MRKLPILIGGTGPKRSLPAVARHAEIWHAFQDLDGFRKSSDRVDELAATFGRNGADIERSIQHAFQWSYAAYYHSAIALTGALVR